MISRRRLQRTLSDIRLAIRPASMEMQVADEAIWGQARAAWGAEFADLDPLIDDSDLLEIGAVDGRFLALLLTAEEGRGAARSVVGLEMGAASSWKDGAQGVLTQFGNRLQLHAEAKIFDALETGAFDVILCRNWQTWFAEAAMETGLSRVYNLLRPGGEFLVAVDCADLTDFSATGKGYGVMTPSSWIMAFQRAGFEVANVRRSLRDLERTAGADPRTVLPLSSDDERSTARMRCRLVRPWEAHDLDLLKSVDQRSLD